MVRRYPFLIAFFLLFPAISCGKKGTVFVPSVGIVILPTVTDVVVGETQQFEATVLNSSSGVTWSVDGGDGFGTVDATGLYTAPLIVPDGGQATVRARLNDNNQIQETSEVNILTASP